MMDTGTKPKRPRIRLVEEMKVVMLTNDVLQLQEMLEDMKEIKDNGGLRDELDQCRQIAKALSSLLWRSCQQDLEKQPQWLQILKNVLSVLTDFCAVSPNLCSALAEPPKNLPSIAVRILESGRKIPIYVKRSVSRFIFIISKNRECAAMIAENSQLVDRIAMAIDNDDFDVTEVALRTADRLTCHKCGIKSLLLSNIGYYLGNLLGRLKDVVETYKYEMQRQIFHLISTFIKQKNTKRIGRQLAGSNGINVLLECFLEGKYEEDIVEMCNGSFELREQFETPGCIEKIMHYEPRSEFMFKMLLCFAQDAWGRAALREQGALDILVDRLAESSPEWQLLIVNTLRHFIHDGSGLNHLAFSTKFLDIAMNHINAFLERNKRSCVRCSIPIYRGYLQSLMPDHPDCSAWSPSHSPPPGIPSPTRKSPSPEWSMDKCIEFFERPCTVLEGHPYSLSRRPRHISERHSMNPTSAPPTDDAQLVVGELYILGWLSHAENNMDRLMTTNIIDTLLRYISEAPSMVSKAPRTIRRIFRNRLAVENVTSLELHTRVTHTILTRRCMFRKRFTKCSECTIRNDFGKALLEEFSFHIDTPYGLEVLKNLYKSHDEIEKIKACIAMVYLIRKVENWERMLMHYKPVKCLLEKLREILGNSNYAENWRMTTYENGPTLLRQILTALSYLVPSDTLIDSLSSTNTNIRDYMFKDVLFDSCIVKNNASSKITSSPISDSPEFIKFTCDELTEVFPKKYLCDASEYFRGMFGNGFSEQFRDTFEFDREEEQCDFSFFSIFLHLSCGCGRLCPKIKGSDVPALLKLSDRYLCTSTSSKLLAPESPIRGLINGETLANYLEVMLSTGSDHCHVLRNACIACLTRYCTEEQMFKALAVVAGNRVATDILVERLETFLNVHSQQRKI